MPSLSCPDCGSALDVFQGVVSRQRTYPLTLATNHGVEPVLVVDRVERKAQIVACSGCEWARWPTF